MIEVLLSSLVASLTAPSCPPSWLDSAGLERLLIVETATTTWPEIRLTVPDCDRAPQTLKIEIVDAQGALRSRRRASLSDIALAVRLRVLAVVIGEMLKAPRVEPEPLPEPPPAPAPPPPLVPPRPPVSLEAPRLASAGATVRTLPNPGSTLLGVRLGAAIPLGSAGGLAWAQLGAEGGIGEAELGRATMVMVTGLLGAGWSHVRPGLRLSGGPAVEGGWAVIWGATEARNAYATSIQGPVVLAELAGRLEVELSEGLWLEITLGLGGALRGLVGRAETTDLLGIAGPSGRLGCGVGTPW